MNLTYEVTGEGYTILKDGRPWVVQKSHHPHRGKTIEESAQLHIDYILAGLSESNASDREEILAEEVADLWYENMLLESRLTSETAALWYEIMMGGNVA